MFRKNLLSLEELEYLRFTGLIRALLRAFEKSLPEQRNVSIALLMKQADPGDAGENTGRAEEIHRFHRGIVLA